MRIRKLIAYHARIPLKTTIRHASYTRTVNDSLIVCCRLEDGTEGWGEGLPRPYVTGETIDSSLQQLRETDWQTQLGGSCRDLSDAVALCGAITPAGAPAGARDCFGHTVRCAIELSVLDAYSRRESVPLSTVTNLFSEAAPIREQQRQVRYSGAITSMGRFKEIVGAVKLRLYGFQQAKVKVGVAGCDDAAALGWIRRALGQRCDLRIDANEAWTCDMLEAKLQPLARFDISALEQPVRQGDEAGLAEVRARVDVPIMLDESLCSLSDAERAIDGQTCDLFNIRLSKCGGFLGSLRLAAAAHQAGLGYQLGCQVGETGILSAAGRHFACSVAGLRYLEGSYDRFLVKERLTLEDITFQWGGYAPALSGPGLGVQVDREALRRVTVDQQHWSFA